jgi:transcriptional regulator with XRE-family HTH domain
VERQAAKVHAGEMDLSPSEAFGQAARKIREERGLTQEKAALDGGIDRSYLGHVERGKKNATLPTIWKMAEALGVPPSVIFLRAEKLLNGKAHRGQKDSALPNYNVLCTDSSVVERGT